MPHLCVISCCPLHCKHAAAWLLPFSPLLPACLPALSPDLDGTTALKIAARTDSLKAVRVLLEGEGALKPAKAPSRRLSQRHQETRQRLQSESFAARQQRAADGGGAGDDGPGGGSSFASASTGSGGGGSIRQLSTRRLGSGAAARQLSRRGAASSKGGLNGESGVLREASPEPAAPFYVAQADPPAAPAAGSDGLSGPDVPGRGSSPGDGGGGGWGAPAASSSSSEGLPGGSFPRRQ